ncbi:MAG: succinyl-diaminopimelate desuccinylase [Solirubrobacteraceae bacterium]|nr:succinyl-diaminopimelate desuccinylase [Solirubrobacteraceae bacterium]
MAAGVVELTQELVRTETINPPGNEARAADLLAARLEAAGLDVTAHELGGPERTSLVARWRGGGDAPALCLTGHLDTVPLGGSDWARDPLGGEIDGDRLYGRGASDMKGGVAAIVVAAERVAALGRGRAGLELVLCAGEETGCDGALALARADGALGRAGALLVAEPTTNHPCVAHKGVVWLDALAEGRTAHGSMPHLGDNAIHKLARAIVALEDFAFDAEPHPLLGAPTLNVGTVSGGINVNSVPDRARAGLDVRIVPGLDADTVAAQLRAAAGDDVRIETRLALAPVDTDPDDAWVREVFGVMGPLAGDRSIEPRGLAYFTDACALVPAYGTPPAIVCGPGDADQAHRTDESCSVAALEAAADGFFEIARRWCGL